MLHAYYVLKKRLQRIQQKNQDCLALLAHKFPFINPTSEQHALVIRSTHRPAQRPAEPNATNKGAQPALASSTTPLSYQQQSPRTLALLSPRAAARIAQSTSAGATLQLLSALHLLSTRCTRLTLHRHHTLLSPGDNKDLVYLVHTGSLSVLRGSNVRTEEAEERNQPGPVLDWLRLVRGDDVGLYAVVREMRDEQRRREARERAERARLRREEAEWEHIKQAGLVTKEMNFLRAKRTRDEQRRQSLALSQQLLDAQEETDERRREAERRQQRWPFSVVAAQTSVVYAMSRAAVRECMREQPTLCVRMCEWMEETEAYRAARWQHIEQQRASDEAARRAEGHLTAFQPTTALPHSALQLPSWQSAHLRTREREREAREQWRREEEKKRTMDDTMHALHSSSVAMLTAVAGDDTGGLGRAGLKSREELDVMLLRARLEAEVLKEAMKKKSLLKLFRSEAPQQTAPSAVASVPAAISEERQEEALAEQQPRATSSDEQTTPSQAESVSAGNSGRGELQRAEKADHPDGQPEAQMTIALTQARSSVSLPPLRFDLLPPPSPVSDVSTASAADQSALTSPFSPSGPHLAVAASGLSSPLLSSAASSMDTSAANSPFHAFFILPKSPPPPVATGGALRTAFSFQARERVDEQKEALIEAVVPLPSFDRTALLPSVSIGPLSGAGSVARRDWQVSRPFSAEVSDEHVRFLMLQVLHQPRPAPAAHQIARRQQPMVLIPQLAHKKRAADAALSTLTGAEQLRRSQRVQSKQHRVERLAQHIATFWQAEDVRVQRELQAEQEELRQQLLGELRRRRQAAREEEERRQRREEAEAERARQRNEDERRRREEHERESFNFVNLRAKSAAAADGSSGRSWSFLTQHGDYAHEAEAGEGEEEGERMYDSDNSGASTVRSNASRRHGRSGSSLQLPPLAMR